LEKLISIKSFVGKSLMVALITVILLPTVPVVSAPDLGQPQTNETDKQKIVHQVAQRWLQVGTEQYRRAFYKAAEQSLLRALDYQEYLTSAERQTLQQLLEKTHTAVLERQRLLGDINKANELANQDQVAQAVALLEKIKDNEFLTEQERLLITEKLGVLNSQFKQQKKQITEVPEQAEPPAQAAAVITVRQADESASITPEEELLAAGDQAKAAEKAEPKEQVPAAVTETETVAAEPVTGKKDGYIEVIDRKRNILQSHTRAVVNDAVGKAQDYTNKGQFDMAKEAVETAEQIVNKNQLYLGEELFRQYTGQLKQLTEQIAQGQNQNARQMQEQKRLEAIKAQREYREQMEIDRHKRITELMDNAMAYQKQQRYEEALGQLESLLAIDPLNNNALILKQTLDDTINFRQQLEIQRQSSKERTDILTETDRSGIPYAEEIRYPRNWREIAAKRKPEEAIGQDPASAAVYRQLDQIIDLSELTPETSFSEAIEQIKTSVEPPLKIFINWRDLLDKADIDQTTPINMDAISAVSLSTALELLLGAVSSGTANLGYAVQNGVITIATTGSLPSKLETLVYDVTDLLGRPANFFASTSGGGGGGGGGDETDVGGGFQDEQQEQMTASEIAQVGATRAESLRLLMQDTIEPDSWWENGGEGTITVYESKKLIVRQTREIHNKIQKLLDEMRKALGQQVAIEARFLLVGENFLEDIGLDIDFRANIGGKFGLIEFKQGSSASVAPSATGIPGSLGGADEYGMPFNLGASIAGGYGSILDDLQVSFLIRATQAHQDSTALTAPKVNVLTGESAALRVQRRLLYARNITVDTRESGEFARASFTVNYETGSVTTGTILNVTPTITPDKKHVLLNITAELRDFLGFRRQAVQLPIFNTPSTTTGTPTASVEGAYNIEFPETEVSRVQTRVSVPDGGTLLLGGQKLTAEIEKETGVPILSKIPILGRAFSNRSKIKDHKILLILVKPTIILQEETEAEAIAALESNL
jgi:type II secretory pathway component GspD/PulD (secretin)/tetratricopeptide (TPR) repeat protein